MLLSTKLHVMIFDIDLTLNQETMGGHARPETFLRT